MTARPFTALVLAAQRPGIINPLAAAAGVSHKCLVPIAGAPLIVHVVRTLMAVPGLGRLRISVEPESWPLLEALLAPLRRQGTDIEMVAARPSLTDSVVDALADAEGPFVITTADNVLLTEEAVQELLEQMHISDVAAVLTTREAVQAVHPLAQLRFYRLGKGHYSNCNLYGLSGPGALAAAGIFREGGQFRRNIGRAIRAFGLFNILLVLSGLLSLDGAAKRLSRRFGVAFKAVLLGDGALAVDVDNERTHAIAEPILARRQSQKGSASMSLA